MSDKVAQLFPRLVLPALTAAVWAGACGGISAVEQVGVSAGAGGDAGRSAGATGVAYGSEAGAAANEPTAGAGSDAGTIVLGPGGSNAACPVMQPRERDSCALPGDVLCKYRYSASCTELTVASCVSDGTWRIQIPAEECGGPPGPACPEWPPTDGAPCDPPAQGASHDCYYPLRCEVISTCYGHWQSTDVVGCAGAGGGG
ncbi:MAG: hypothetical protein ABI488_15815 [Polyangiaceae bacterium]